MEKTILVPFDFSEVSKEIVRIANDWGRRTDAKLYLLHSSPNSFFIGSHFRPEDRLKHITDFLEDINDLTSHEFLTPVGKAYINVITEAKKINPDLIIMAAHDHTIVGRMLLGSNTDYIVHHATCPVYVYKLAKKKLNNIILLPLDFSDINLKVIKMADEWAQEIGAELAFVYVGTTPEFVHLNAEFNFDWVDLEDEAVKKIQTERFEKYVNSLEIKSKFSKHMAFGRPGNEIVSLQMTIGANLIMMAAHSHTILERMTTGSVTDHILHHVHCPVYVYKH
ncbi:MAG: universal stress protein [Deltaproteobacteria bacterium]|nr:universal stress protein [Deltaproteobacteria bacterium]